MSFDVITNLSKAMNLYRLHGPDNPATVLAIKQLYNSIRIALATSSEFSFAVAEGIAIVNGDVIPDAPASVTRLNAILEDHNISSVTFLTGVLPDEVQRLVRHLALDPGASELGEAPHVVLKQLSGLRVSAATAGPKTNMEGAPQTPHGDATKALSKLVGLLATSRKVSTEQIRSKMSAMLAEAASKSRWDAHTALGKVKELVSDIDPQARLRLFGDGTSERTIAANVLRIFPPEARAMFIAETLLAGAVTPAATAMVAPGASARDLSDMLVNQLLSRVADPEQQAELVAKSFQVLSAGVASAPPQQGRLSKTIAFRVSSANGQRHLRNLSKSYQANFRVTRDTEELLALAPEGKHDVAIVDEEGIGNLEEFFEEFRSRVTDLPVILISGKSLIELPPAVMGYPRLEILSPMADLEKLVELIGLGPEDIRAEPEPRTQEDVDKLQLQRAREVVNALLPQNLPDIPGFEVSTYYTPALHIGGDYLDVFELGNGTYGLTIADVSGKGVPGALVMTTFRSILKLTAPANISPRDAMVTTNDLLRKSMVKGMFVTALYGMLDPASKTLKLANSGHNPSLLLRKGAAKPEYLRLPGLVLGIVSGPAYAKTIQDTALRLSSGDLMVWYTDGLTEAFNEKRELYSDERLIEVVNANRGRSADAVLKAIVKDLEKHRGNAEQSDDVAIIIIRAK